MLLINLKTPPLASNLLIPSSCQFEKFSKSRLFVTASASGISSRNFCGLKRCYDGSSSTLLWIWIWIWNQRFQSESREAGSSAKSKGINSGHPGNHNNVTSKDTSERDFPALHETVAGTMGQACVNHEGRTYFEEN